MAAVMEASATHSVKQLCALSIALHARLETLAENASAARIHLTALYSASKSSLVSETGELNDERARQIDANFAEVSADIDRAESQKKSRLEAELVATDEALTAAQIVDTGDTHDPDPDFLHVLEPVESDILRVDCLPADMLPPGSACPWAVCAPRGLRTSDICLRVIQVTDRSDASGFDVPVLELVMSDEYESRGPNEVELALHAACTAVRSRAHLETGPADTPSHIALAEFLVVDSLRKRIVLSFRVPAGSMHSDATVTVSGVSFRGVRLTLAAQAFPLRIPTLPADVNVLWETHYLQLGPWRVARSTRSNQHMSKCMAIWNDSPRYSDMWVLVELVLSSNGWFRFERGPTRSIHWGSDGFETTTQDLSEPWNMQPPLRPVLVSTPFFESTMRSPDSCLENVRFLGLEKLEVSTMSATDCGTSGTGSTASFSLCLIGSVSCTFLPDGSMQFSDAEMTAADVARRLGPA